MVKQSQPNSLSKTKPLISKSPPPRLPQSSPLLPSPLDWSQLSPSLPSKAGVYWFLDAQGKILYIGKAKNLKRRLLSYSRIPGINPRLTRLIKTIHSTRFQELPNEFQAILVEAQLINLHQPTYNIRLKDDRSRLYIALTKDPIPRLITIRKTELTSTEYRHLFGPFISNRETKRLLNYTRKIIPFCSQTPSGIKRHQPCFYFHLKQCPGVCTGLMSPKEYQHHLQKVVTFLKGSHQSLISKLTRELNQAMKQNQFEICQRLKLQIQSITSLTFSADPSTDLPMISQDSFYNQSHRLTAILSPHYSKLPHLFSRIETYDIANLMGRSATASMVVFSELIPDPQAYRHFKIRSLSTPNDFAMLVEVIGRRLKHSDWPLPDIFLIDGGTPQLKALSNILPSTIPLIGLAKHPDHLVVYSPTTQKVITHSLDPSDPLLHLCQQMRDEAHRFARRLHHHLQTPALIGYTK